MAHLTEQGINLLQKEMEELIRYLDISEEAFTDAVIERVLDIEGEIAHDFLDEIREQIALFIENE